MGDSHLSDQAATDEVRVLVVDGDAARARGTVDGLADALEGAAVELVGNAGTALARIDDDPIDCVVTEYDLPDTDGVTFLERVRERDATLPFVVFTDAGSESVAADALNAGASAYFRPADGVDALAECVGDLVAEETSLSNVGLFRQIVDASREIIWVGTADMSEIVYINPVYEEKWGGGSREALYDDITYYLEFLPEEARASEREDMEKMARWAAEGVAPDEFVDEYRYFGPDGEVRWAREIAFPIRDGDGTVAYWGVSIATSRSASATSRNWSDRTSDWSGSPRSSRTTSGTP